MNWWPQCLQFRRWRCSGWPRGLLQSRLRRASFRQRNRKKTKLARAATAQPRSAAFAVIAAALFQHLQRPVVQRYWGDTYCCQATRRRSGCCAALQAQKGVTTRLVKSGVLCRSVFVTPQFQKAFFDAAVGAASLACRLCCKALPCRSRRLS